MTVTTYGTTFQKTFSRKVTKVTKLYQWQIPGAKTSMAERIPKRISQKQSAEFHKKMGCVHNPYTTRNCNSIWGCSDTNFLGESPQASSNRVRALQGQGEGQRSRSTSSLKVELKGND